MKCDKDCFNCPYDDCIAGTNVTRDPAYYKKYYQNHKKEIMESRKKYYEKNKEKIRAYHKEYYRRKKDENRSKKQVDCVGLSASGS